MIPPISLRASLLTALTGLPLCFGIAAAQPAPGQVPAASLPPVASPSSEVPPMSAPIGIARRSRSGPAPGPATGNTTISVAVGGQELVEIGTGVTRIALGNPQIADISVLGGRQLRVLGMTAGSTDIFLWRGAAVERMRLSVAVGVDAAQTQAAVDPTLRGVRAGSEGGRVVLRGDVPNLEASQALAASVRGRDVVNQTRITSEMVVAVEVMFAAVQATRLQQLGFNFRSLGTSVQGSITGPGTSVNSSALGAGTSPPAAFAPSGGLAALAGSAAALSSPMSSAFNLLLGSSANNILGAVSMLATTNFAQVLAQPVLLVRSGEQASFLAGGEIPVPTPVVGAGFSSVTIDYRPFGVRLDIAATVMSSGRIVLRVSPEVSELDYTNAITLQGFNIPALRKRSASTTVELGDGQSFMLAGLSFSNTNNLSDRIPAIGQLPIIGALFARTNATREQQELVIIATPRLVRPVSNARLPAGLTDVARIPNTTDILLQRNTAEDAANRFGFMR
ncbi:MAG: type and secretion system protein [Rubritepida sp.]|nr:type and secretion system protein [Rubritepida sp.]